SPHTLQPGPTNISYETEFIGRARIDAILPDQGFTLPLAVENRIRVKRRLLERASQAIQNGKRSQTLYRYQITLSNHLDQEAIVTLRDQLPLSTDDAIRVELTNVTPK